MNYKPVSSKNKPVWKLMIDFTSIKKDGISAHKFLKILEISKRSDNTYKKY